METSQENPTETPLPNHGSTSRQSLDSRQAQQTRSVNQTSSSRDSHRHRPHSHLYRSPHISEPIWFPDQHLFTHRRHHKSHRHQRNPEAKTTGDNTLPSDKRDRSKRKHKHNRSRHDRTPKDVSINSATADDRMDTPIHSGPKDAETQAAEVQNIRLIPSQEDGITESAENDTGARLPFIRRREIITMDDVKLVGERRMMIEESNRQSLSTIATRSTDLSQRLDYTYYNLLDKVANIRSTIRSLQNLSNLTSNLHTNFNNETINLERDNKKQIDDFKNFDSQVRHVENLEQRMRAGQEKSAALEERLEAVKRKIDAWDRREGEWQARVSWRLKILWAVMGTLAFLMAVAIAVDQFQPESSMDTPEMSMGNIPIEGIRNISGRKATLEQEVCPLRPSVDSGDISDDKKAKSEPESKIDPGLSLESKDALFQKCVEDPLQRIVDEL